MKEFSESQEIHKSTPISRAKGRMSKRWKIISNGTCSKSHMQNIRVKIFAYDQVLKKAKQLLLKPGDVYFERDYRHDNVDAFSVHSFITPTFYWNIHCDLIYNIIVHYQFQDCPHEDEIKAMFNEYRLIECCSKPPKELDLPVFLKGVIAYQKPAFIHTL